VTIVGQAAYRDGRALDIDGTFDELSGACRNGEFVWVGLKDPSPSELDSAMRAFGIHPLAVEDAQTTHERPKVDVFGDTLTLVLRPARYDEPRETVEFGQITIMCSPHHVLVVRHGEAVPLDTVRAELEADPELLANGPGAVLHKILDSVVEAYLPVLEGIDGDIGEVEGEVFDDRRRYPTQRIYELKREVLQFRKAVFPLESVMETLTRERHPVVNDELRRYLHDTEDDVKRVVDQIHTENELLTSVLEANLTQVGISQNEDMRKMSAWVAILAVPTMVAGIYGMNFEHMPELETRFGYFVVMGSIALVCGTLYYKFRRAGWL
jgi:magnesium transporter